MTEMAGIEVLDLTEFVHDASFPCEYGEYEMAGHHSHAQFVAFVAPCSGCGKPSAPRLICEPCKNTILYATWSAMECTHCGFVYAPAKLAFKGFEPINRRAA